jgi:hypothetical protein
MSDDIELTGQQVGLDRREVIKRGAILGGVVWAAPVIQSIGSPAFAITPTPVGTPTPTPELPDISFIAAVLTCSHDGEEFTIRVKYSDGDWEGEPGPPGGHPSCNPDGYADADRAEDGGELGLVVGEGEDGRVFLFIPTLVELDDHTCVLSDAAAFVGLGNNDEPCLPVDEEQGCTVGGAQGTCYYFEATL